MGVKFIMLFGIVLLGRLLTIAAQPATDIVLFDLIVAGEEISLANPRSIYTHAGYDNQPFFLPNEDVLLFSSQVSDQTDIFQYNIIDQKLTNLTSTPDSEYSPTVTPDGNNISTIILESTGRQLLWQYPRNGGNPNILVPDLKIGYHCWLDNKTIATFVLGDQPTLQICNLSERTNNIIASNIGRSLHRIPGTELVSFVDKNQDPWVVKSYEHRSGSIEPLITCLPGGEDMTWSADGTLFMGQGSKLYKWQPGINQSWELVEDLSKLGYHNISRLSINWKVDKIAIVVEEPD